MGKSKNKVYLVSYFLNDLIVHKKVKVYAPNAFEAANKLKSKLRESDNVCIVTWPGLTMED
jgi:hypothetical protein